MRERAGCVNLASRLPLLRGESSHKLGPTLWRISLLPDEGGAEAREDEDVGGQNQYFRSVSQSTTSESINYTAAPSSIDPSFLPSSLPPSLAFVCFLLCEICLCRL